MQRVVIREAHLGEMDEVGALRVDAYEAQNLLSVKADYADTLRVLGAQGPGTVLVAVAGDATPAIVGTVMVEPWHSGSEIALAADEVEMRALAVGPRAQGRGVGRALVHAATEQAHAWNARQVVLSTQPAMTAAHRLYRAAGFTRLPERDWAPIPGLTLLAFGRVLGC